MGGLHQPRPGSADRQWRYQSLVLCDKRSRQNSTPFGGAQHRTGHVDRKDRRGIRAARHRLRDRVRSGGAGIEAPPPDAPPARGGRLHVGTGQAEAVSLGREK
uniref:(northern house mosquito) hypothetical protein n=1 Tax=Culex pipiens TaxID=7175 RepID=A0A8D8MEE2_CULPI